MMLEDGEYYLILNGIQHWYRVAGAIHQTTPLVVIHGGPGGNVYNFERTIGPHIERFTTIVYYEQRGCGRSAAPAKPDDYSVSLLLDDLDNLRQHLGLERIIPIGFSFGGELALEYALTYPDCVAKVVAQAPSLGDAQRAALAQLYGFEMITQGALRDQVRALIAASGSAHERLDRVWQIVDTDTVDRFLFYQPDIARLNRRLWRESGLRNTGDMMRALELQPPHLLPLRDRLANIQAPTLVLVGLHDRNSGVEINRDVATLIPSAQFVIFERSTHFPEMEEPEVYARVLRSFLAL
jgi:proline iminopeptidase